MLEETRPDGHGRARGLVSSRVSGRRVASRTYAPPGPLREVVDCFWIAEWDLRGQAPHVVELLADPCVNVAFERGGSRVVGVSRRLWRRELAGAGRIRAVKLRAGAARALWPDLVVAHLSDRVVPLHDLVPGDPEGTESEVLGPGDEAEGLAALAGWLEVRVTLPPEPRVALAVALVDHIAADPGMTSVGALARAAGLGPRALQRLFREHVGASPKWVIRRFRLQEAALRLERGAGVTLAALAAELGYSDHAHLTRDFRAATGRAPSTFARDVWR